MLKNTLTLIAIIVTTFNSVSAETRPLPSATKAPPVFNNYQVDLKGAKLSDCFDIKDKENLRQIKSPQGEDIYALNKLAYEHYREWKESIVSDEIISLNVISIPDVVCQKRDIKNLEFFTPIVDFLSWKKHKIAYQPRIGGMGWIVRGLEPPDFSKERAWSQVKITTEGKRVYKYEDPAPDVYDPRRLYLKNIFLKVSKENTDFIMKRAGKAAVLDGNLWAGVFNSDMPVYLTEGVKKAGSMLSAGYAAVGMTGVCAGMHTMEGSKISQPRLHSDIEALLQQKRALYLVFDYDHKADTRRFVENVIAIFGNLLHKAGASVKVVILPGPEKGVDDFILARGISDFDTLVDAALDFSSWKAKVKLEDGDLKLLTKYLACRT